MKEQKKKKVVVTTDKDKRGVFYGECEEIDYIPEVLKLGNARMAIYWPSETKGVLGLASIGPQEGSKITPPVPSILINGVTALMECSEEAIAQWEKGLWG